MIRKIVPILSCLVLSACFHEVTENPEEETQDVLPVVVGSWVSQCVTTGSIGEKYRIDADEQSFLLVKETYFGQSCDKLTGIYPTLGEYRYGKKVVADDGRVSLELDIVASDESGTSSFYTHISVDDDNKITIALGTSERNGKTPETRATELSLDFRFTLLSSDIPLVKLPDPLVEEQEPVEEEPVEQVDPNAELRQQLLDSLAGYWATDACSLDEQTGIYRLAYIEYMAEGKIQMGELQFRDKDCTKLHQLMAGDTGLYTLGAVDANDGNALFELDVSNQSTGETLYYFVGVKDGLLYGTSSTTANERPNSVDFLGATLFSVLSGDVVGSGVPVSAPAPTMNELIGEWKLVHSEVTDDALSQEVLAACVDQSSYNSVEITTHSFAFIDHDSCAGVDADSTIVEYSGIEVSRTGDSYNIVRFLPLSTADEMGSWLSSAYFYVEDGRLHFVEKLAGDVGEEDRYQFDFINGFSKSELSGMPEEYSGRWSPLLQPIKALSGIWMTDCHQVSENPPVFSSIRVDIDGQLWTQQTGWYEDAVCTIVQNAETRQGRFSYIDVVSANLYSEAAGSNVTTLPFTGNNGYLAIQANEFVATGGAQNNGDGLLGMSVGSYNLLGVVGDNLYFGYDATTDVDGNSNETRPVALNSDMPYEKYSPEVAAISGNWLSECVASGDYFEQLSLDINGKGWRAIQGVYSDAACGQFVAEIINNTGVNVYGANIQAKLYDPLLNEYVQPVPYTVDNAYLAVETDAYFYSEPGVKEFGWFDILSVIDGKLFTGVYRLPENRPVDLDYSSGMVRQ